MWQKFKNWFITTWHQLDNWQTALLFGIVVLVMYAPVWGGYLLYWIFKWKWCLWVATGALAFWAAPFTPFFPLCMAITLAIKKFFIHVHQKTKAVVHSLKSRLQAQRQHSDSNGPFPVKEDGRVEEIYPSNTKSAPSAAASTVQKQSGH